MYRSAKVNATVLSICVFSLAGVWKGQASTPGLVSGSQAIPASTNNLTTLGTVDWAHWGLTFSTSFDHKAAGGSQISNFSVVNGEAGEVANFAGNPVAYSWSGGSPDATVTNTDTGVYISGLNRGFSLTVPADTSLRTLSLFVGVYAGTGKLRAHLSDSSAADYIDTSLSSAGSVPGLYTLTYQAASAGQTLTVTWTLNSAGGNVNLQSAALSVATAPDFTISATPLSQSVVAGNSATVVLQVAAQNGFNGTVSLGVSGQPLNSIVSFTPSTIAGGTGNSSLAITVPANATLGDYPLSITGTSGSLSHSASTSITVTGPPDFTIGVQPSSRTVAQGAVATYTVNILSANGFGGAVNLALSGQPSNSLVTFSPNPVTGGSGSSTLSITVPVNASITSYALTITGTSGVLSHTASTSLTVIAPPPPDFTISVLPSSQTVSQGGNTSYTVTVAPSNGFSSAVSLSLSGQPTGSITSFTPVSIANGNGSSNLSIAVPANAAGGAYTLTVTGTFGTLSHSATGTLVVNLLSSAGLTGALSTPVATQNLTTLGTSDWAHWGLASGGSFDHKANVTQQISNFTVINGQAGNVSSYDGNPIGYTWTDGTPDTSVANTAKGVYISSVGRGFQITVPADTSTRSLTLYLGVFAAQGKLAAHLSDSSSPDYVDTSLSSSSSQIGAYTVQYSASSAGQTLTIAWTMNSGVGPNGSLGNVNLQSAALVLGGTLTPNFTSSVQPATQTAGPGGTASYIVTITSQNNFTGTVALGVTGLPQGAIPTFTPSSISGGSGSSNLSISIPSNATPNTYGLTITATSGVLSHPVNISLQVTGPPDFAVDIQPGSENVSQGNSTSYVVSITPTNGFTGTVTLAATGLPSGMTPSFSPSNTILGGSGTTNLTVSVASNVTPGIYPFTVAGASGALNHSAGATLMVIAGGSGPVLTGSLYTPNGNQNLTLLGTADWAHWGLTSATSFDHKSGVTQLISNYTTVNTTPDKVVQTADTVPTFSWTDGRPDSSASPNGTAVNLNYATALNTGFQFTVAADTTSRLLNTYVCVTNAQGRMTAHLSDNSAPDYTDTSVINGSLICVAYTFVYRANSAGQTLTITWTMSQTLAFNSAVYLQAATVSVVTPSAGFDLTATPAVQQILAGTSATYALNLAPNAGFGATATFIASGLPPGASAAFSPSSATASGAPVVTISTTAAVPPGSYPINLIASAPGINVTAPVTLTILNTAQPYLGGAFSTPSVSVPINLTTTGTSDWAHWGLNYSSAFDDKASGNHQISNVTVVNGEIGGLAEETGPPSFSWTDGTPDGTVTSSLTGVYVKGANVGFQITAPADTTPRTLIVYLGVFNTQGLLTAHLSDSSSPDYVDTSFQSSGFIPGAYTLSYKASLPNQSLTVRFTLNSTSGPRCTEIYGVHCTVSLQSATLANH